MVAGSEFRAEYALVSVNLANSVSSLDVWANPDVFRYATSMLSVESSLAVSVITLSDSRSAGRMVSGASVYRSL